MKLSDYRDLMGGYKKKPSQSRSNKTSEDLMQTAIKIYENDLIGNFTAQSLAEKSGYSVGVLYRFANKFEDYFINIFVDKVLIQMSEMENIISSHNPNDNVKSLIVKYVDHSFSFNTYNGNPRKGIAHVIRFFIRRGKKPEIIFNLTDSLTSAFLLVQQNDKTNTFKKMSALECTLKLRAFSLYIRTPYMDPNNTLDVLEHKQSCIDFGALIFSN